VTEIATGPVVTQDTQVQVTSTATAAKSFPSSAYLLKKAADWTWQDLRDYVIMAITEKFDAPQRDLLKEAAIFKGFISRYGTVDAVLIATCAFEINGGVWRHAPITITRFTKNNDPYFADVLLARWNA
jgi:hypothetical protein